VTEGRVGALKPEGTSVRMLPSRGGGWSLYVQGDVGIRKPWIRGHRGKRNGGRAEKDKAGSRMGPVKRVGGQARSRNNEENPRISRP